MDIKFEISAATRLLQQMNIYCKEIQKETREMRSILKTTNEWNDRQKFAFQENIDALAEDLNQALQLESDYMRTYHQRVQQLTEGRYE